MSTLSHHFFSDERRAAIMDMLERNASIQVSDIAQTFGVSVVTARSDLDALADAGKLRRTHGGAVSLKKRLVVSTQDRRVNVNVEAKRLIAKAASEFVHDGDTILLDSGTTALEFVRTLGSYSSLTIVTPDITIANLIDETLPGVDVVMLGGTLRKGHRYVYGPLTLSCLASIHADIAVICPGSFVSSRGLMTEFPQMAELKSALISSASYSIALLDSSKANNRGTYRFANLSDFQFIVMDKGTGTQIVSDAIDTISEHDIHPKLIIATPENETVLTPTHQQEKA